MRLVVSPMCKAFSTWQRSSDTICCAVMVAAETKRAVEHLQFRISFTEGTNRARPLLRPRAPSLFHLLAREGGATVDEPDRCRACHT